MPGSGIFDFNRSGVFSLDDANKIVGIIRSFTQRYSQDVSLKINQLEAFGAVEKSKTQEIEKEVQDLIEGWNTKIKKLGAVPKGLWLVDLDAGDGYFCWKFPESSINYWHDYQSGYTGRITLDERSKRKGLYVTPQAPLDV